MAEITSSPFYFSIMEVRRNFSTYLLKIFNCLIVELHSLIFKVYNKETRVGRFIDKITQIAELLNHMILMCFYDLDSYCCHDFICNILHFGNNKKCRIYVDVVLLAFYIKM